MYVLSNELPAFLGAGTIAEISCAANKMIFVHRIKFGQATSETDDSGQLTWGTYTASGTGDTVTGNAKPVDPGDSAYAGVAKDAHTVDLTTGEDLVGREGISMLAGFEKIFLPRSRPILVPGEFFGLNEIEGINSVTAVYEIEFEEIG
jgi:hypothetical protein